MEITSLNPHSAVLHLDTKYSCLSTLRRFLQRIPINRTGSILWSTHYSKTAFGTFDRLDFYSLDFVRVEASHPTLPLSSRILLVGDIFWLRSDLKFHRR